MENRPLITVIVMAYNNAELIYETLDSIFIQDYPNIELIISDDASPTPFPADDVIDYVNEHRGKNIRQVILNQNPENLGTVRHLEVLREKAHGEIELCIAADDAWADSGVFTAFADEFDRLGPEAECITSRLGMYDKDLKIMKQEYMPEETVEKLKAGDMDWLRDEETYRCVLPAIATAFRRSIFPKIGKLSHLYKFVEDYSTHVRMTRMHIPVYFLDRFTVKHRDGGISHGNTRVSLDFFRQYHQDLLNIYLHEVEPFASEYSEEVMERARNYYLWRKKAFQDQEERAEIELQHSSTPTGASSTTSSSTIMGYSRAYMRELLKGFLRRISTVQQMQMMLITAALLLLASSLLRGWAYPLAPVLCAILYWIGVICFVGFVLQLCINLMFKARRLMWFFRGDRA